jgi:hypothetical protein
VKWLLRLFAAVKRWLLGSSNSSTLETQRTSYRISPLKWQRYLKWRKGNPSSLWVGSDQLALLRELVHHQGWEVFKRLVELRLDYETDQLVKVQPQDQTNYRRGIVEAYATIFEIVEQTLEEKEQYDDRSRKRDEHTRDRTKLQRGANVARHWGSPNWYDHFAGDRS